MTSTSMRDFEALDALFAQHASQEFEPAGLVARGQAVHARVHAARLEDVELHHAVSGQSWLVT